MVSSKENKQANERYKEKVISTLVAFLKSEKGGEQWVRQVASNAVAFPFVNDLGEEEVIKLTISVPTGSRDGEPYDMDLEADDFEEKQKAKAEKQKEAEEKKKKKIEADKKKREAKAEMKARKGEP